MRIDTFRASALGLAVLAGAAGVVPLAAQTGGQSNGTIVLTSGATVTQDFNTLSSGLPTGFAFAETGQNANNALTASTGSGNAGDTLNLGTTAADRALGGLRSGNLIPSFGVAFTNSTGSTINGLQVGFTGEQFRLGAVGRADRLDFQFAVGTSSITSGTFTDFDALDFSSPSTTGSAGMLDGNAALNRTTLAATLAGLTIGNGQAFTFRFQDFDATGADDALGIDDFSLTPLFQAVVSPVPEPQSWAMMLAGFGMVGAAIRRRRFKTLAV